MSRASAGLLPLEYANAGMFQLGYVFADISGPLDYYANIMGATPFLRIDDAQLGGLTHLGRPASSRQNIAFGFVGSLNIEFIEPLGGVSCYSTFLNEHPGGGLHHIGCKVADFDQAVGQFVTSGFEVAQSGRFGKGTRFAYFDTRMVLGHYLEILFLDESTERLLDEVRNRRAAATSA